MVPSLYGLRRLASPTVGFVLAAAAACLVPHTAHAAVAVAARGPAVARIELAAPAKERLMAGETVALQATAFDAMGNALPTARLGFRVTPPLVGKVTRGVFSAKRAGTAEVVATAGRIASNAVQITVNEVGRIDVTPGGPLSVHQGDTLTFQAQAFDVAGAPLPNETYPNVPLTWKAAGGVITPRGALAARRAGRVVVTATSGRTKSNTVYVSVRRRQESLSTHAYLTGQPVAGVQSACITIARIEVMSKADQEAGNGNWQTFLTGEQIHALVGQPLDVQRLNNLRIQLGTAFLPEGEYRRARITFDTTPGANYVIHADGRRVDLTWGEADQAVLEIPFYLFVIRGYPLNAVFELLLPRSIVLGEDNSTLFFEPYVEFTPMDDLELKQPFGSAVGQLQPRDDVVLVFASTPDTGGNDLRNYFGSYDPETGHFRISSLPAGTYELGVTLRGQNEHKVLGTFQIVPGQDSMIPGPITVP